MTTNEQAVNDILTLKPRSKPMREKRAKTNWLMVLATGMILTGIAGIAAAYWHFGVQQNSDHALKKLYFEFCVQKYLTYRNKDDQAKADRLCKDVWDASLAANISPFLFVKVVEIESAFNCRALSHAGAFGCAQVLLSAHRGTFDDLISQRGNLFAGAAILRENLDRRNGDVRLALLDYNRGPGMVTALLRQGIDPENGYATKAMRI